jgi:glycosyltransferase involved in cell wall biosynthesis
VLFLTHYWPPEYGPDPPILHGNARVLQSLGAEVDVIAAMPSYPTGLVDPAHRGRVLAREVVDGVPTLRTWTLSGPRAKPPWRLANELSFDVSCLLGALPRRRYDHVLAVTPPLTLIPAAWLLSRLFSARLSLHVMDLHPEAAIAVGRVRRPAFIAALRALAGFGYQEASVIVTVTASNKAAIEVLGVDPARVVWIPNGIDTRLFRPVPPDEAILARARGTRLCVCAGTMSPQHDLDTILDVAERLQREGESGFRFLLLGTGTEKPRVARAIADRGLRDVWLDEPVPRERLPGVLAAADVVLVTLRDLELNRGVVATRLYDAMACGRPVIVGAHGEMARLVREADAGVAIEPENPAALLAAVRTLTTDPVRAGRCGDNGRRYAVEHFDRARCGARLHQALLHGLTRPPPAALAG